MGMAVHLTPEEYLATAFEGPDCEYIDGALIERNCGEKKHSLVQFRLAGVVYRLSKSPPVFGFTGLRLQMGPTLFRIPDLSIYLAMPEQRVPSHPPAAVIEVVSPDDRYSDLLQKLAEYAAFGVPHIWVIDPELETFSIYRSPILTQVQALELGECGLYITPSDLFTEAND